MGALQQLLLAAPSPAFLSGGTATLYATGTNPTNINDNNSGTEGTTGSLINFTSLAITSRILAQIDYGTNKVITRIYARAKLGTNDPNPRCKVAYWDGSAWQVTGAIFLTGTTYDARDVTGLSVIGSKVAIVTSGNGGSEDNFNGYTLTCSDLLAEGY